ncbi:MAG: hypothetical protein KKG06_12445 [Bacteroidetes bacterium]|nr:hypothetical protein [Bacteroidota bacterium]
MDTKIKTVQRSTSNYEKNIVFIAAQSTLNVMEQLTKNVSDGCVIHATVRLCGEIKLTNIFGTLFGSNNGLSKDIRSISLLNKVDTVYQRSAVLSNTGYNNRHRHHTLPWHGVLAQLLMAPSSTVAKGF